MTPSDIAFALRSSLPQVFNNAIWRKTALVEDVENKQTTINSKQAFQTL
jgi:hypothetical protein